MIKKREHSVKLLKRQLDSCTRNKVAFMFFNNSLYAANHQDDINVVIVHLKEIFDFHNEGKSNDPEEAVPGTGEAIEAITAYVNSGFLINVTSESENTTCCISHFGDFCI